MNCLCVQVVVRNLGGLVCISIVDKMRNSTSLTVGVVVFCFYIDIHMIDIIFTKLFEKKVWLILIISYYPKY